jgi:hypothetical protein
MGGGLEYCKSCARSVCDFNKRSFLLVLRRGANAAENPSGAMPELLPVKVFTLSGGVPFASRMFFIPTRELMIEFASGSCEEVIPAHKYTRIAS